jgi:hypothetical protein
MAYNNNYGITVNGKYIPAGGKQSLLQPFDPYAPLSGVGSVSPFVTSSSAPAASAARSLYNVNPTPTQGVNNPAGLVPGPLAAVSPNLATTTTMATPTPITPNQVGAPATVAMPDPYGDLLKIIPGLAGMNAAAGSVISNDMAGKLNPDVIRAIQTEAARFGVTSGMPGTGGTPGSLANFRDLATVGMTSDTAQQRGLASYSDFLKTISGTQTVSPGVQAQIGGANADAANQFALANNASLNQFSQFNQDLLARTNQWNAGALNQGSQFNASAGNALAPLNVDIANRNAINAAAPDPWLALNYGADLYTRNAMAVAGKPYTSMFAPNTATGGFGGFAAASGTVDPWTTYLNQLAAKPKWGSSMLAGYGAPGFGGG